MKSEQDSSRRIRKQKTNKESKVYFPIIKGASGSS
jgi:hypothetical protein